MFRALLCSSSGNQNCVIQHLVSSHSVSGRTAVVRFSMESETFLFSIAMSPAKRYNQLPTQWVQEVTLWGVGWG